MKTNKLALIVQLYLAAHATKLLQHARRGRIVGVLLPPVLPTWGWVQLRSICFSACLQIIGYMPLLDTKVSVDRSINKQRTGTIGAKVEKNNRKRREEEKSVCFISFFALVFYADR